MSQGLEREEHDDGSEPRDKTSRFLDLVHVLNARCLELLSRMSATPAACDCSLSRLLGSENPWRDLSAPARQRIARLPFLIVDIHFMDSEWWRRVSAPIVRDGPLPQLRGCFRDVSGAAVTQEAMMLAWHGVQLDRRSAAWKIGMSRGVVDVIWQLSTQDVLRIAGQFPCEAQPRWGACTDFWRELIAAAEGGDRDALQDAQREAMLRLSGQMVAARGYDGG